MKSLNYRISNKEFKWAFSSTKVKFLEKKLLSQSQIDSLMGSENRAQFLKQISDTRYGIYIEGSNLDIEKLYSSEIAELKSILPQLIPEKDRTLDFLFIRQDIGLLKNIYKLFMRGSEFNHILSRINFLNQEALKSGFEKKEFSNLLGLEKILNNAVNNELPSIDKELDKYYFSVLKNIIKKNSKYIQKIIRWEIDFYNIKMILRYFLYEIEGMAGRKNLDFMDGGLISVDFLNRAIEEDIEFFIANMPLEYKKIVSGAWENYKAGNNFVSLDIGFYNLLISHVKEAKFYLLRVETVVAYILALLRELMLVRRAFMLANNEIQEQNIREQTYAS